MELTGVCPGRKPGDAVELAEQFANHLAGIFALTELFDLRHEPTESVFSLRDGHVGVVFALTFETRVVLVKLLPEEVGKAVARHVP